MQGKSGRGFGIKQGLILSSVVILAMFALSLYAWMQVPEGSRLPVHWGASGRPDRYGSKFEALMLIPIMAVLLTILFAIIPAIEPRQKHMQQSRRSYLVIWALVLGILAVVHGLLVLTALGSRFNISIVIFIMLGLMFLIMGYFLERMESNFFMGIRTPWTLSSEISWKKTHHLGSRLFMVLGAVILVLAWLPGPWVVWVIVGGALGEALVLSVYSYWVWRGDPNRNSGQN